MVYVDILFQRVTSLKAFCWKRKGKHQRYDKYALALTSSVVVHYRLSFLLIILERI